MQKSLTELRKESGLLQRAIAVKVGVSVKTIQNWEKGTAIPNAVHLKKIASVFNCKMDDIFLP